jgi:hypothetical protein
MEWQPIETAPRGPWILLAGKSGYVQRPCFAILGRWDSYKSRWEDTESNPLHDYGLTPTHWVDFVPPTTATTVDPREEA